MKEVYLLHTRNGARLYTRAEIIENARQQENAGIIPRYRYNDSSTPPGWLVWSTIEDGAGVVYKLALARRIYHSIKGRWKNEN